MSIEAKLDAIARETAPLLLHATPDGVYDRLRAALAAAAAAQRAEDAALCERRAQRFVDEAAGVKHPFRRLLLLSDAGEAKYGNYIHDSLDIGGE